MTILTIHSSGTSLATPNPPLNSNVRFSMRHSHLQNYSLHLLAGIFFLLFPLLAEARYTGYNSGCRGASCVALGVVLIAVVLGGTAVVTYQLVRKKGLVQGLKQSKPLNILIHFLVGLVLIVWAAYTFNA